MPDYWAYWGKADSQVDGGHHLAVFHCLDVAAVSSAMVQRSPVLRRKLGGLMRLEEERVAATVAGLVALHDVGKFDVRFQMKAPEVALLLDATRTGVPKARAYDHGSFGYQQLLDLQRHEPEVFNATVGAGSVPLLQAVCGHHGAFPSHGAPPQEPGFRAFRQPDRAVRSALVRDFCTLFGSLGAALPRRGECSMALMELIAGLCSVADWLGSQHEWFPYCSVPTSLAEYYRRAEAQASRLLNALPLNSAEPSGADFQQLFEGKQPRDVQLLTEALPVTAEPSLVIVEAGMGTGKTEAALSLATRMMMAGAASGLYVALPTMATSNGMFGRAEQAAEKMFRGSVNLRLAHGRARSFDPFDRLVQRSLQGSLGSSETEADVVCARWFLSRKRALLGQFGVGTVDQAMQAAIKVRHHFVRAFGLAQQVVILDEVHAYDAYMEVILERLVEWLGALRAPVVLLSATLPAERRNKFASSYASGAGWSLPSASTPDLTATRTPYPCVTVVAESGVRELSPNTSPPDRRVAVRRVATGEPESAVIPILAEAVGAGATVCWIRNTVGEAQAAFEAAVAAGLAPELFHARFRGCDRSAIERKVLADYGPRAERKGRLLIATQVVEQSLDLDFDLLITDLCPIDLLLQRCGRLQRHPIARPRGYESPVLVVVEPEDAAAAGLRFGVSGKVYDPATLWLSRDSIREELLLPSCIRGLVEDSYDPETRRRRLEAAGERHQEAERKRLDELESRRQRARVVCIPPTTLDAAAIPGCHEDDDAEVQALTRDGDSTTLLLALWDSEDGVAGSLDGGDAWVLEPEAPDAWRTARELQEQVVSVPAYPWDCIERGARAHGEWRAWEAWEQQCTRFLKAMGMGEVIVVPVTKRGEVYAGRVTTSKGEAKRVRYGRTRGLWFPKEES